MQISKRAYREDFWIGMNDLDDGISKWSDNTPVVYSNFGRYGLNNNDADRCVKFSSSGTWTDSNCNQENGFICKRRSGTYHPVITPTAPTKGNCPTGYSTHPQVSHCYKVFSDKKETKNFNAAQKDCTIQSKGGNLATIHNDFENDFIVTLLGGLSTKGAWIGMEKTYSYRSYQWMDGSQINYVNWAPSQNRNYNSYYTGKCVTIKSSGSDIGMWTSTYCYTYNSYVCQRPKSTALPKQIPDNVGCNPGYRRFGDSCYKLYTSPYTWKVAEKVCVDDQGHLMSISDGVESALFNVLTVVKSSEFWLGLKYDPDWEYYKWSDAWPVTYVQWGADQPLRLDGGGCVSSNISSYWEDSSCLKALPFVCEMNLGTPPSPTFVYGVCPDGWALHGAYCYYVEDKSEESRAWAKVDCQNKGGKLASILSAAERNFVSTLIKTYYAQYWIGLMPSVTSGYHWDDGSPVDYDYFRPYQYLRARTTDSSGRHEICVTMSRSGYWNKIDCYEKHGYVCKKPQKSISPTSLSTTTKSIRLSSSSTTLKTASSTNPPKTTPSTTTPKTTPSITTPKTNPRTTSTTPMTTPTSTAKPVTTRITRQRVSGQTTPQSPIKDSQKGGASSDNGSSMSGGSVAGIVIGVLAVAVIVLLVVIFLRRGSADGLLTRLKSSKSPSTAHRSNEDPRGFDNMMYNNTSGTIEGPFSSDA